MYFRYGKRVFDAALALACLTVVFVPMGFVALAVLITSGRPVFFIQNRVGRGGRLFRVIKFRTMNAGISNFSSVTVAGDARVTPVGRLLRKYKLDEVPQLWNVLKGEMSFVGPRPDVPGYHDKLRGNDRRVLLLRPGITGPSSLKYADEEKILAGPADPVAYNNTVIFPDKVRINLKYLDECSLFRDLGYIWKTVLLVFR